MLNVVKQRLGMPDHLPDILALYDELSTYIHPNPQGHQHRPLFDVSKARMWLRLRLSTTSTAMWLYSKTLHAIDFYDEELARFMQYNYRRLSLMSMSSLRKTYCGKLMQNSKASS
jgi:hypothetical protein